MHPGRGGLTDREEPGDGRTAVEVSQHTTHDVVRSRSDGNRLRCPVDPGLAHESVDRGESGGESARASEAGGVEQHGPAPLRRHGGGDRSGDDVARSELSTGIHVEHEAAALLVAQDGTLAAHGFGDEPAAGEHGGMELHELEVGDGGAGAVRQHDARADRGGRIRGVWVERSGTASGQHDGVCLERLDSMRPVDDNPGDAGVRGLDARDDAALTHQNPAIAQPVAQRGDDDRPGRVAPGVQHAGSGVRRFQSSGERAVGVAVERRTPRQEFGDSGGAICAQGGRGGGIGEAGARRNRVDGV